ncbi:MAG: sigma-54-dependent Fis family transcriptional regulator [Verrucomicrobiae bacterium]|nr:sigma-54-dependent Fis family transcriptional regulator [Verrucomicrobiae bacterium]
MEQTPPKILLIEDDASAASSLQRVLVDDGNKVDLVTRGDEGLRKAKDHTYDVVITDLKLPGIGGLELIRELLKHKPQSAIILITAHGTTEVAIEATKLGAFDYLLKPFEMPELLNLVGKAVASARRISVPIEVGRTLSARDAIIGNSRAMQAVYKEIGKIAAKPVTVLIRGETGSGKELVARAIYQYSDRSDRQFVVVNCAAIPENLLESELFGHERGAFTGADTRRIGRFEQADHGTLFLDEIGEMSANTQTKFLRVLQERCLHRVGGKESISVDVRVIAATNRDLEAAIEEERFRQDLYYRLSVAVITLPPLRKRKDDIPDLTKYFLHRHGPELGYPNPSISPRAMRLLEEHAWPGNVRELENVIRKAIIAARGLTIGYDDIRIAMSGGQEVHRANGQSFSEYVGEMLEKAKDGELDNAYSAVLETAERELFSQAIRMAKGNKVKAAKLLGVSRQTVRQKLEQFNVDGVSEDDPKAGKANAV